MMRRYKAFNMDSTVIEAAKMLRDMEKQCFETMKALVSKPEGNTIKFSGLMMTNPAATTSAEGVWFIRMTINDQTYPLEGRYSLMLTPPSIKELILKEIVDHVIRIVLSELRPSVELLF